MRFFITGATGYIGSAIVRAALAHKHEVHGLVRSDSKAQQLADIGARPIIGTIEDPSTYRDSAAECDVLIHTAAAWADRATADRIVIETLIDMAYRAARPRSVIFTSGVWALPEGGPPADENSPTGAAEVSAWRVAHEYLTLNGATDFVATAVVRPAIVYGGDRGIVSGFFRSARERGAAEYVGDGQNRWSLAHVDDVARLYRLIGEKRARGIFHAAEDAPMRLAHIAQACSDAAGVGATRSIPLDEARETMGVYADALASDRAATSPRSIELGWQHEWEFRDDVKQVYEEWSAGGQ